MARKRRGYASLRQQASAIYGEEIGLWIEGQLDNGLTAQEIADVISAALARHGIRRRISKRTVWHWAQRAREAQTSAAAPTA